MSVVIETTLGDITVDLYLSERPRACLNFLKLCKMKYYNFNLFHTISRGFIAQTGDPTGSRSGGESIYGVLDGPQKRYFETENEPRIKHTKMGLISFVGNEEHMIGSQFFLSLGEDLTYLDEKHCVFGEVVEGFEVLEIINEVICDTDDRPYQDVRITHTVILDDPYPDPKRLKVPSRSPSPSAERLQGGRIAPDEEIDETEGKSAQEVAEMQAEREAKARATILEMVGDIPDAEMAPPENVLFVCKLNPLTSDDDLEVIFNRFGKIKSCEVIRDKKSGDSLQYAFIEFEDRKSCEDAYFKMDNILIDDRRIHVDFSQSVSKVKWHGKGRGVTHYDERGKQTRDNIDIGKGKFKEMPYNRNISTMRKKRSSPDRNVSNTNHNRSYEAEKRDRNKYNHERSSYAKYKEFKYRSKTHDKEKKFRSTKSRRDKSKSRSKSPKGDKDLFIKSYTPPRAPDTYRNKEGMSSNSRERKKYRSDDDEKDNKTHSSDYYKKQNSKYENKPVKLSSSSEMKAKSKRKASYSSDSENDEKIKNKQKNSKHSKNLFSDKEETVKKRKQFSESSDSEEKRKKHKKRNR